MEDRTKETLQYQTTSNSSLLSTPAAAEYLPNMIKTEDKVLKKEHLYTNTISSLKSELPSDVILIILLKNCCVFVF